ncbi:14-3-3 domain containing protein [Pyrenophora tritici-repentis]|nr:14-3-3 domain containing protein [Pyrenophora tritici-repentis]KAI2487802.1 14-3-3 domain containing protein [Pyrenophora tritici-repentis]
MASLDFDQKFLGRIAKQTEETNPFLSSALYQILGLSVLLARRLIRARKLRKLDTSRDTPSLAAYQHILWMSREGLSILELYILPYAQDNQHGPECRVLSVKLRASFYHIFCLFHNQPPVTTTNMTSTDPRHLGAPPLPLSPRNGNGYSRKTDPSRLSPPSKRAGKQPTLREPVDSIVSETSFVTNPYPSASGYFTTATQYATSYLPGSHPLRLSVALEHSAFLWDCLHDHDGSRRIARRAIKDVYRAQEAMDDTEFEDAAELVGILGRMMKRKSWEGTPRVGGMASPEPVTQDSPQASSGTPTQSGRPTTSAGPRPQKNSRRAAEGPPMSDITIQIQPPPSATRSRANTASKSSPRQKESKSHANSPRSATQRHVEAGSPHTTPRTRRTSHESGSSTTPRAPPQGHGPRSPTTPSTVRTAHQTSGSGGSSKGTPVAGTSTPLTQSAAATLISDNMRNSPTLRRTPPTHFSSPEHHGSPFSPSQESSFARQKR